MRKFGTLLLVAAVSMLVGAIPASALHGGGRGAHGGGWHGGGWHGGGGVYFGLGPWWGPWWDYPYDYDPYLYAYPYAYPAAPVQTTPPAATPNMWYYCRVSKAYYPYVSSCPEVWQKVLAQPPQSVPQ